MHAQFFVSLCLSLPVFVYESEVQKYIWAQYDQLVCVKFMGTVKNYYKFAYLRSKHI